MGVGAMTHLVGHHKGAESDGFFGQLGHASLPPLLAVLAAAGGGAGDNGGCVRRRFPGLQQPIKQQKQLDTLDSQGRAGMPQIQAQRQLQAR